MPSPLASTKIDYSLPEVLIKSKVSNWSQACLFLPDKYIDLPNAINDYLQLKVDQENLLVGKVISTSVTFQHRAPKLDIVIKDLKYNELKIGVFGDTRELQENLITGQKIHASGLVKNFNGQLYLNKATIYNTESKEILPIYPVPKRLKSDPVYVAQLMKEIALKNQQQGADIIRQLLGIQSISKERLFLTKIQSFSQTSFNNLILSAHYPDSLENGYRTLQQFTHLASDAYLRQLKKKNPKNTIDASLNLDRKKINELISSIPFTLTDEQKKVVHEIVTDLKNKRPMKRMLIGDVGYGKSIYLIPCCLAYISNYRVAILLPTSTLAQQQYDEWKAWWPEIPCQLVMKNTAVIDDNKNHCFIGTTALLSRLESQVDFIVVDEQHLYGIDQKKQLSRKNVLEVSATPIPKSLSHLSFGGLKTSYLTHSFIKRDIKKKLFLSVEKHKIVQRVSWILNNNGQAAVVYPLAETSDPEKEIHAAASVHKKWAKLFPTQNITFIHGGLSDDEKIDAINKMKTRKSNLLISTTVISTGITIEGLNYICIAGCEVLGASQIWQLFGRVGRKSGEGYCDLLLLKDVNEDTMNRLQFITQAKDGMEVALNDMRRRGIGSIVGKSQSGKMDDVFPGKKLTVDDLESYLALE